MAKRKHHFVPRFYLKQWGVGQQICVYHIASARLIAHASLRDQCYARRLYGPTSELEDALADLEGKAAVILRKTESEERLPEPGSPERWTLLQFLMTQYCRTQKARDRIRQQWVMMDEELYGGVPPEAGSKMPRFSEMTDDEVLWLMFTHLGSAVAGVADLKMVLLESQPRQRFWVSDSPVFRYNTYCKGIPFWGSLGAHCSGLQIFFPLSPRFQVMLLDDEVYKSPAGRGPVLLNERDVRKLNAVQYLDAVDCIYLDPDTKQDEVDRVEKLVGARVGTRMRIHQAPVVGTTDQTMIHTWEGLADLRFQLPYSRLRFGASRTPLPQRRNQKRTTLHEVT